MKALRYAIPFPFLALVPLGTLLGGIWTFLPITALPVILAGLDGLFGFESPGTINADRIAYRLTPWLYIPLQIAVTGWAAATIVHLSILESIGLTLSVGLTARIFGMLATHEMVHSRSAAERALGLAFLASVG